MLAIHICRVMAESVVCNTVGPKFAPRLSQRPVVLVVNSLLWSPLRLHRLILTDKSTLNKKKRRQLKENKRSQFCASSCLSHVCVYSQRFGLNQYTWSAYTVQEVNRPRICDLQSAWRQYTYQGQDNSYRPRCHTAATAADQGTLPLHTLQPLNLSRTLHLIYPSNIKYKAI